MNRIFKVVWNESRETYTVCDENKKTHGKAKSVKAAVIAASVAAMMGLSGMASATNYNYKDQSDVVVNNNVTGEGRINLDNSSVTFKGDVERSNWNGLAVSLTNNSSAVFEKYLKISDSGSRNSVSLSNGSTMTVSGAASFSSSGARADTVSIKGGSELKLENAGTEDAPVSFTSSGDPSSAIVADGGKVTRACNAFCGHLSEKGRNPVSEFDAEPIQC